MEDLYDFLPEYPELDQYVRELIPGHQTGLRQWIVEMWKEGQLVDFSAIVEEIQVLFIGAMKEIWTQIVLLFGIMILSAFMKIAMDSLKNKGAATVGEYFFVFSELCILFQIWNDMLMITNGYLHQMITFLKVAIPAFMTCVIISGKEITGVLFQKILLSSVCAMEGIGMESLFMVMKIYIAFAVLETVYGEGKFIGILTLFQKGIHFSMKGCFCFLGIGNAVQLLLIPTIDRANDTLIQKSIAGIPGIGDLSDAVSNITLSALHTIKSSVGVAIIILLALIILPGVVKMAGYLMLLKGASALGKIVAEENITRGVDYFTIAGDMLLKILVMIWCLFFTAIALLITTTAG